MKIGIIGPGAVGCLFAAKLTVAGIEVVLIDHSEARAVRLNVSGIDVEENGSTWHAVPEVSTKLPEDLTLIIVLVKAYSTSNLNLPQGVPVLTLQNALNNAEILAEKVGDEKLYAGTTSLGVTKLSESSIRYVAPGITRIGAWGNSSPDFIMEILSRASFDVEVVQNPAAAIWQKAVINAAINPLTAMLDVPNGQLLANSDTKAMLNILTRDAAQIAAAEGYPQEENIYDVVKQVCENTAENIASMLQDIRNDKETEIDALSGEIVRRAEKHSLLVPATEFVWHTIRALEQR